MPAFDFSSYAAVLLDLDGTLSHEEEALPGAAELIKKLESDHTAYAVLSNSTLSPHSIGRRLARLGMKMRDEHIYTAAAAAADHVIEKFGSAPAIYNLATEEIGELFGPHAHWVQTGEERCDVVICGAPANRFAGLERQRTALKLLRQGADLVGICADRIYTSPRGIEIGVGALTHMLEYAANTTATFTGKPNRIFFDHLCQRLGVSPQQCILIGDNLESDVAGAAALGMKTILPLTGVTQAADIEQFVGPKPDWIIQNLTDLL